MNLLKGKKILISGISNEFSIAFGIAKSMYRQKAQLAFTYKSKRLKEKITRYAKALNSNIIIPCNVSVDNNITELFYKLSKYWKKFDGFVHSIAFAPTNQFNQDYVDVINRASFRTTHEITSYSFVAMAKACRKMLNKNSSLLTLSYLGSSFVVPNYNIMGVAKSSLESNMRYMAYYLGKEKIRVNAISIGPIKTLSTNALNNFNKILYDSKKKSLIRRNVTIEDVGNVASFLCSNLSTAVTGQVIYVDGGSGKIIFT